MKEHFALSKSQLAYLNGSKTLKNASAEKNRIRKKAIQSWSIFIPILKSKIVDGEWKLSLFQSPTPAEAQKIWNINNKLFGFEEFLKVLFKTNPKNPRSDDLLKMQLAQKMIKSSISFYSNRFEMNKLILEEIDRFQNVLSLLYDSIKSQQYKDDAIRMYEMRKRQTEPPRIKRDEFFHALCMHCYYYSLGLCKTEKEALQDLQHDENCTYHKRYELAKTQPEMIKLLNDTYVRIFKPIKK